MEKPRPPIPEEKPDNPTPCHLLLGGTHAGGEGYPNAWHTVRVLERELGILPVECGCWLPDDTSLWRWAKAGPFGLLKLGARLAWSNLVSVCRVLREVRGRGWVYVPYPAVFFLWWISWLPRRWRPTIIADAYISLWDSWIRDRGQGRAWPFLGRLLKAIEGRALKAADYVLTDTRANEAFYVESFGLEPARIHSFPLAIDEDRFLSLGPKLAESGGPVTVLFVGTMIPLHGVKVILAALDRMQERPNVRYRLIGDGQQGKEVERALESCGRNDITWVREWQSIDDLAQEIAQADICLGIFGGTPKSARVLPFKIYMYLAAAKPIISQEMYSLPAHLPPPPLVTVPPGNPRALAEAIQALLDDAVLRARLGKEGREYFKTYLGSASLVARWQALLRQQ